MIWKTHIFGPSDRLSWSTIELMLNLSQKNFMYLVYFFWLICGQCTVFIKTPHFSPIEFRGLVYHITVAVAKQLFAVFGPTEHSQSLDWSLNQTKHSLHEFTYIYTLWQKIMTSRTVFQILIDFANDNKTFISIMKSV